MECYTIQLSQHRLVTPESGILLLDTTVKSGERVFSPTWDIVLGVKSGKLTETQYTNVYRQLMQQSYQRSKERWLAVCATPKVAIACYCPPGTFCHRHLLKTYFEKCCLSNNLPFVDRGELTKETFNVSE